MVVAERWITSSSSDSGEASSTKTSTSRSTNQEPIVKEDSQVTSRSIATNVLTRDSVTGRPGKSTTAAPPDHAIHLRIRDYWSEYWGPLQGGLTQPVSPNEFSRCDCRIRRIFELEHWPSEPGDDSLSATRCGMFAGFKNSSFAGVPTLSVESSGSDMFHAEWFVGR